MFINLDYITEITNGNKELFNKLIAVATTQLNTQIKLIEKAINENNVEEISQRAHCMKNALHILGIYSHTATSIEYLEHTFQKNNIDKKECLKAFKQIELVIKKAFKETTQLII